jgi:hypothetical protein
MLQEGVTVNKKVSYEGPIRQCKLLTKTHDVGGFTFLEMSCLGERSCFIRGGPPV